MSRHAACKLPLSDRSKKTMASIPIKRTSIPIKRLPILSHTPHRIPVPIPVPSDIGIVVQVKKVSDDVCELQKNIAVESAARNELQMCVDQLKLKVESQQAKQCNVMNVGLNGSGTLQHLMKTLPCKTLGEFDWLLAYITDRSLQWTEYIKLLGGSDFNSAIKITIDNIMDRSVQKQLSWSGVHSNKPSMKYKYKAIVDGIHVAMRESFKDYTIAQGEAKIHSMLKNACKSKNFV